MSRPGPIILLALLLPGLSGCLYHSQKTLKRTWFDWNTYGDHALVWEFLDVRPMKSQRIETFRWLHQKGPGTVRSMPSEWELAGYVDEETSAPRPLPETRGPERRPIVPLPLPTEPEGVSPPVPPLPLESPADPPAPGPWARVSPNAPRELPPVDAVPVPVPDSFGEGDTATRRSRMPPTQPPRLTHRGSWLFRR